MELTCKKISSNKINAAKEVTRKRKCKCVKPKEERKTLVSQKLWFITEIKMLTVKKKAFISNIEVSHV